PGGCIGASVFGPIEHNPAPHALSDSLDARIGPGASLTKRNEHALADVDALRELFHATGFEDVRIDTVTKTVSFSSPDEYVRVQSRATPLAALDADEATVEAIVADVSRRLAAFSGDDDLAFPQEAHVVIARVSA